MKKIYLVAILVAVVSFTFAQKKAGNAVQMQKAHFTSAKSANDTLIPASCLTGTPTIYGASGGGFVTGTNSYGDLAKVQEFVNTASIKVDGCMFWIGAKQQIGTAGTVNVNLYDMTGTGTTTVGTGQPCPGTVLATVPKTIDVIDSGTSVATGFNVVNFTTPTAVTADFAIGLDFANIGDDTIGIVSTTDGDATTELTYDKWSDGTWTSFKSTGDWGLSFDMYIFAIVDTGSAGINDNYFYNGMKLSCNPNPVVNSARVQYEIQNNSNVSLTIYDLTGKIVASYNEGNQMSGKHEILDKAENFSAGTYYYSLKSGSKNLTKKMMVTK